MSKLVTAAEVQELAARDGTEPKYLVAVGTILTPGAIDMARNLGVQILHPGPGIRSVIQHVAEEMVGNSLSQAELDRFEAEILTRIKEGR